MNPDAEPNPDPVLDEEFTVRLLACDEALAAGETPPGLANDAPAELRERLQRGLACVERLQQLRPQRSALIDDPCPTRIGRFEIRCPLGRGGFGIVYRAYDPVLCREVALKIPRADVLVDDKGQARFEHEARAAAGLDHPNLVPVFEAGRIGPICFIAFAYCPGSDLAAWLRQRTAPVRCLDAARLVRTLARAIHYAHGRGVLHRDLKPSNVLLSPVERSASFSEDNLWTPDGESPLIPRVTDFGMAKFAEGDQVQTESRSVLGTPSYMAPEQTEGRSAAVGPATDVHALGVLLYEVLTGRPPFWAESTMGTLLQVKSMEATPPSRLRPDLPRDLETICLKCLQKEGRKRYASAAALAEDLDRFLAGRPIEARPSSRLEQALKWARRRPGLAASLAALILVTIFGTVGILLQWQETQDALGQAVTREQQAQQARAAEARERERSEITLYHHRVNLAHHEWLAGNVVRAAQLLDECRLDLRHWEWRYVRRLCDSSLFTCVGHTTHVMSVAFSPDGRRLASAAGRWNSSEPGQVKVWDAATGAPLWTGAHNGPVMCVAFSPDGSRVASGTSLWDSPKKGEVKIRDAVTGEVLVTIADPSRGVFGLAFSPQGDRLATGGADGKVRLWDVRTGNPLFELAGHTANVFTVAFNSDGSLLASGGWDGKAFIWELATRRDIKSMDGPDDLRSVAFSRDNSRLVAASFDHSVKVWEISTGRLLHTYWGHRAPALCAAVAPDGRHIASSDTSGMVHVWDMHTGRLIRTIRGHSGPVSWIAYNRKGDRLASAGREGTVRVWDITRDQDSYSLPEATGAHNVVFSPKGRWLAASGYAHSGNRTEKRVRIWAMDQPLAAPKYWEGHTGALRCVAFSSDEALLASGSADGTVRLWNVGTGRPLAKVVGHTDMVSGVAFNHDNTWIASASLDKTVRLWNVAEPSAPPVVLPHPGAVHDVAFAPDGKRFVTVGARGMVIVWDAATHSRLFELPGHGDVVERAVFSPDGRRLATAGWDKTIRIWDMTADPAEGQTPVPLHILTGHAERIFGLSFSSDGLRLASTGGGDQTVRIWDVATGNEALILRGHPDSITGVAFSPGGRLLVSASSRDIKVRDASDRPGK
jgi:WD40 repeat protein/serine/threonine protein kinase